MRLWLIAAALGLGLLVPLQPLLNAEMRRAAGGSGFLAALINFLVGLAALLVCWLAFRPGWPTAEGLGSAPWWAWTAGLIGGAFVVLTMVLAPRLGVVLMLGLILVGQMVASLVVDHYGLVGAPVREATPPRILGVLLVIAGVVLVQLGTPKLDPPAAVPGGTAVD